MIATELQLKLAHVRLLNAVVGFNGALRHGSIDEMLAARNELKAAQDYSQQLRYPVDRG